MKKRIVLAILVIAVVAAWAALPGPIDLQIAVARHDDGREFWQERQTGSAAYAGISGVTYLRRDVGKAFPGAQGWASTEEAFAFFDRELASRGWTKMQQGADIAILPESRFLETRTLRQYTRPGDIFPPARVALAVWPIGGDTDGFNVVLVAANPSLLYRMSRGFD